VDDVYGSAQNFRVSDALVATPNLIALGTLIRSSQPADPDAPRKYTYETNIGDNSMIEQLAKLSAVSLTFAAAGDLGANSQTLGAYAGQIISTTSSKGQANKSDSDNAKLLLDGFNDRNDAVRGVNLDEELANTIIYQNAYAASARIITVADQLFQILLQSAGGQ
jgi:flagellar hook-associated protein 1